MWDVNNHGDWGLITQQSTVSSVVGNAMAVDNEMSVYSMLTNTTINHGYRCPIKFVAERAGTASVVLCGAPLQTA